MKSYKATFDSIKKEVGKVIIGQEGMVEEVLVAILANSNALLEGFPGLAKTLAVRTLSEALDLKFSRIQNTPDLMPSDITGTYIIEEHSGKREFKFQPGPVFANIVLADEINRATPKTQSAMLEAMQERQVTVGNSTFKLDEPFFVLATQNPIEQEGTYPLPEAQADRFLLKIKVGYPTPEQELEVVNRFTSGSGTSKVKVLLTKKHIINLQEMTTKVPIAADLKKKVVNLNSSKLDDATKEQFIKGAKAAYEMIITSFAKGDKKTLKPLLYNTARIEGCDCILSNWQPDLYPGPLINLALYLYLS